MPNLCIIPARAISLHATGKLTATDIIVLCSIGEHTDRNGEGCWAYSKTLSEKAGIARSTFFGCTERLIAHGLIERESGKEAGRSSTYRILLDARVSSEPDRGGESSQPDTPRPASEIPESSQPDSTTINDPINDPSNAATTARRPFTQWEHNGITIAEGDYCYDIETLIDRVNQAGGDFRCFIAELYMARMGEHGYPQATPQQIGDAVRAYNANGAEIAFRLFKAYLRDALKPREAKEPRTHDTGLSKVNAVVMANDLIARLRATRKQSTTGVRVGHWYVPADWRSSFTEYQAKALAAIGPENLLSDNETSAAVAATRLASLLAQPL